MSRPVRVRIWPSWHPLITGLPRRIPLVECTRQHIGIEYDYIARRGALARQHNGRLP